MVIYVLLALLMLGILITVHEWGHFIAARLTGIPVREFSIGFGPLLKTWESKKHGTKFSIRLIPAGGYCAFYGENSPDEKEDLDPRAMRRFPVWKRLITVFAGPFMNFVLAFLVAFFFYWISGIPAAQEYGYMNIAQVNPASAAEEAGLKKGDVVIRIGGEDAKGLSADGTTYRMIELVDRYREGDAPLELTVQRGEETLVLSVTPRYSAEEGRMLIGVSISPEVLSWTTIRLTLPEAARYAGNLCVEEGTAIIQTLGDLIRTGKNLDQMSGTVGVIRIVAETTRDYALEGYLSLLVMISVNLALVNLLPIPGLDGSQIVLLLIEAVRRKPLPRKVESVITMVGLAALMLLFVVLTYQDLRRLFTGA